MFSFKTSSSLKTFKASFSKRAQGAAIPKHPLGFRLASTIQSSERQQKQCSQTLISDTDVVRSHCDTACGPFCSCINACRMKKPTNRTIALHCSQFALFASQTFKFLHIEFLTHFSRQLKKSFTYYLHFKLIVFFHRFRYLLGARKFKKI